MSTKLIPSYSFSSLQEALDTMSGHTYRNVVVQLRTLRIDENFKIVSSEDGLDGSFYLSNLSLPRLAKVLRYPTKNLEILSDERIRDDLNYLLEKHGDLHAFVRLFDDSVYDFIISSEMLAPVDHTAFLRKIIEMMPEVGDQEKHSILFENGQLTVVTRSYGSDIEPIPGDLNSVGLHLVNTDYNSHNLTTSYHVYRTVCSNSALGIDGRRYRATTENALTLFANKSAAMLRDKTLLAEAYTQLSQQPLTEHTYRAVYASLRSAIGTTKSQDLIGFYETYIEEDLADGKTKKVKVFDEKFAENQTEYDLFNEVTNKAKELDRKDYYAAISAAGKMVTGKLEVLRQIKRAQKEAEEAAKEMTSEE